VNLYFRNEGTFLWAAEERSVVRSTDEETVRNVLAELCGGPRDKGLTGVIPPTVERIDVSVMNTPTRSKVAEVTFDESYALLSPLDAADCIGSVVWTLTDLDFIFGVKFYCGDMELARPLGTTPLGILNRHDVMLSVSVDETVVKETVTLYFADGEKTGLVSETRGIERDINQPIEYFIVKEMISGPLDEGNVRLLPHDTGLISAKKDDVICYLDFSDDFTAWVDGADGELMAVASIVNALTERQGIKMVQFLVNGDKVAMRNGGIDLNMPFERMDELIIITETDSAE